MAELFNPFNRTVTGLAWDGQVPVQLRIEEGRASRAQVRAVQGAYAQFSRRATFSRVPNPSERGVLDDGSAYRITSVGNTTIVQLWPVGSVEVSRKTVRGISFTLRALDGSILPEHALDKVPINYVLTPQVNRDGERIANGMFKIHCPKKTEGGALVSRSAKGDFYIAGGPVGGSTHTYSGRHYREKHYVALDEQLINTARFLNYPGTGIREMAYFNSTGLFVEGDFAFVHTTAKGGLYLMGLTYEPLGLDSAMSGGTRVKLYVTPYRKNPAESVSSRMFTVDTPVSVLSESTTFNSRGTQARVHYGPLGATGVLYMQLGVDGLVVEPQEKEQSHTAVSTTGSESGDNYSYVRTTQNFSGDVGDYFNRIGEDVRRTSYVGTIVYTSNQNRETQTWKSPVTGFENFTETTHSTSGTIKSTTAGGAYAGGVDTSSTTWDIARSDIDDVYQLTRSYSSSSEQSSVSSVFLDDAVTGVSIALIRTVASSDSWSEYNGEKTQGPQSSSLQFHLVVRHGGKVVQQTPVPEYATDWDLSLLECAFSCKVAQDVDTDCLLISLVKSYKGKSVDSWTYLAGRRFFKPLSDVLRYSVPVRTDTQFMTV